MKILVVDDTPLAREITIELLENLGHTDIVEASDGHEALACLERESGIEMILLDRYMPAMDGFQFMREVRSRAEWRGIYIAMVTGESDHEERFRAVVDFQADYYITKPVTRQALVRLFARYRNDM